MTMAIAGSLAGTLGLSGGMLSLSLNFNTRLNTMQIFAWAIVAGFFGIFFGANLFETLVLPERYTWPFSKANAAFINTFYSTARNHGYSSSLWVFGNFFLVAFAWFSIPNYFMPFLLTLPLLCLGGRGADNWTPIQPFGRGGATEPYALASVLSSGVAGAGFPGIGGWATCFSFGPSIVPLRVTTQIFVSVVLFNWLFIPAAFWDGLVAWPSSFREFNEKGGLYNGEEGHYHRTGERVYLSGVGMTMYFGVALSITAMFTDSLLRIVLPAIRFWIKSSYNAQLRRTTSRQVVDTIARPVSLRVGIATTLVFAVAAVLVVQLVLPAQAGAHGLGLPAWGTCFFILYAFISSIGSAVVYATTGQNFTGGACILGQILCGLLVPGSARANIISVMLVNTAASQALGVLTDLKTAVYLNVTPRSMFRAQLIGAAVGVCTSVSAFIGILALNDAGVITLGSAQWPAVGAESQTLNAKLFGEQGIGAILHGQFMGIDVNNLLTGCGIFAIVGTSMLYLIPDHKWWKAYLPDPMLLGMAGLYSGLNFSATSLLIIAFIYQRVIKEYAPRWYAQFQYVSTAGVNAGVGIAGILVVILATLNAPTVKLGPEPVRACNASLPLPARTFHDVACWNSLNGGEGCNTPWPSN